MSSSTQDLLPHLDLGNTFGGLFIGVILAAFLFGVTNVQAFVYFQTHGDTGMSLYKLIVIWLWILDALHLSLIIHCVYYYLVTNYANINVLTEIVWSFKLQIVIDVFVVYGVHVLYVYRIWIVSKDRSRALPATVGIIVILLASGIAIVVIWVAYDCHSFADILGKKWTLFVAMGSITFSDFLIASSLCYILATSRTGFSGTDSLLTKFMVYSINTGCLTSVCSITATITCAVMPKNFVSLVLGSLLAKLYVNSYFVLLNARYYVQSNHSDIVEKLQESQKNAIKRPYNHDRDIHPTCPIQVVTKPIAVTMEIRSSPSV